LIWERIRAGLVLGGGRPYNWRRRAVFLAAIHVLYVAGYLLVAHHASESTANLLVILPPAIAALALGTLIGLLSFVVCAGLMVELNLCFGTTALLVEMPTAFGGLALLAVVVTLGGLRDLSDALKNEVTTHLTTRRALERSEEKYRNVVERASDGIVIVTEEIVHFANQRMAEMLGRHLEAMMGQDFLSLVHPADRERITRLFSAIERLEPSESFYDIAMLHRDGHQIKTEFSIGSVPMREGRSILLIVRDVSLRFRMQEERDALEEQLRRSQKLESLGRLASGVAHDINNILSTIMNSASILAAGIDDDKKTDIENIIIAAKRGGALTKDLLGFARKGKYTKRIISVNDVVHGTLSLLVKTTPKNVEVISHLDLGVTCIEGDPEQLEHALMNVLLNSVDAIGGRLGTIRVRTSVLDAVARNRNARHGAAGLERRALVEVTDDGCGMRQDVLHNAFDPFFTTKEAGDGAGLGLSMVYGTVVNHGGTVDIASEEGEGTTVKMMFPIVEGAAPTSDAFLGSIPPDPEAQFDEGILEQLKQKKDKGCVLVVDDEEPIRKSTKRFLKAYGYEVLVAENGEMALRTYERERRRIHVILLDIIMPVMDGFDAFYALKERGLDAEVILISGFCADSKVEQMVKDGAFGFLQKPVDMHVLAYELYRARVFHQSKPDPDTIN
jgi:two-component system, cell cycle sensor histidine kinase and response regulator CckA